MSLPNDTARCGGWPAESQRIPGAELCRDCQRRTQIALDDPAAFFWQMSPAISNGRCVYRIEPQTNSKEQA